MKEIERCLDMEAQEDTSEEVVAAMDAVKKDLSEKLYIKNLDFGNLTLLKKIAGDIDYLVIDEDLNIDYIVILEDDKSHKSEESKCVKAGGKLIPSFLNIQLLQPTNSRELYENVGAMVSDELSETGHVSDPLLEKLVRTIEVIESQDPIKLEESFIRGKMKRKRQRTRKVWLGKKFRGKFIPGPPFRCPSDSCGAAFDPFQDYINHIRATKHHLPVRKVIPIPEGPPFTCPLCDAVFETLSAYRTHRKYKHRPLKVQCPHCPRMFTCKSKMSNHLVTHSGEKNHQCEVCAARFNQSVNLRRHMLIHSNLRPFVCNQCGRGFNQRTTLNAHMLIHTDEKSHLCSVCGKTFRTQNIFKKHMARHDASPALPTLAPKWPLSCKECGAVCHSTKAVREHYQKVHGRTYQIYECDICHRQLYSKSNLQTHMNNHLEIKPFGCSQCSKSFATKQLLKFHESRHAGVRPFECELCGKRFNQKPHLNEHMIRHSGIKMWECRYCPKRFFSKGALTCHTRTHTGETPYSCEFCGMRFRHINNMKSHRKRHLRQFITGDATETSSQSDSDSIKS